jgi:hypothetical protein
MDTLQKILIAFGISCILIFFQNLLKSTYMIDFLDENLITILIALLAINLTTLSIVLTKIRELIDKNNLSSSIFENTQKEILYSIKEQIALIFLSLLFFIFLKSELGKQYISIQLATEVLITSCFVYGIMILYDTAKSIFIIIDFKK